MTLKEKIFKQVADALSEKIIFIQNNLEELRLSASNETKSTAGDKHETALAMLQIEQENKNRQLRELLLQKLALDKIDPTLKPTIITTGSLVQTNKGLLFISIGLGKVLVENQTIICLSIESPLGQKLKGLKERDKLEMNGVAYFIESIQ